MQAPAPRAHAVRVQALFSVLEPAEETLYFIEYHEDTSPLHAFVRAVASRMPRPLDLHNLEETVASAFPSEDPDAVSKTVRVLYQASKLGGRYENSICPSMRCRLLKTVSFPNPDLTAIAEGEAKRVLQAAIDAERKKLASQITDGFSIAAPLLRY